MLITDGTDMLCTSNQAWTELCTIIVDLFSVCFSCISCISFLTPPSFPLITSYHWLHCGWSLFLRRTQACELPVMLICFI